MNPRRSLFQCLANGAFAAMAVAGLALRVAAQDPQLPPPPPGQPAPFQPGAIVPIPAAGDATAMVDSIRLSDNPLSTVLDLLEQLTGRSVIRPQQLPTPTFTFNSHGAISKRDAIIAIESLLSLNNIAVAPMGEKFIKVVVITNVRTEAPELVLGTLADQPPSGKVVSKLFRLQHLDTTTFQNQVQPFLSPGFGSVVPFQNSNTLLVTDTISNLQRLEYVLAQVDRPRDLVTKFYTLKYAQAQAVAEKMKSLIETTRTAFNRQGGAPAGGGAPPPMPDGSIPGAPPGSGGESGLGAALLSATTSINYDERTNQVILVTDSSSVMFYQNLVEKLDVQADPSTQIAVIHIQHAQATDVASLLSSFVSGTSSSSKSSSGSGSKTSRPQRSRETFPGMNKTNTPAQPSGSNPVAGGSGERPSQFSNYMTIIADERSNAIIASGTQDDLNLIRELVRQVDIVLPQVQIDVLVASVTLGKKVQRGIDALTGIQIVDNKVVGVVGAAAAGGTTAAVPGVRGSGFDISQIFFLKNQNFTANMTAENKWDNVHVVSVPTITTTHNQEATITVAKAVPITTSSYTDASTTVGARNSYSYQNIGLELTVKPLIGADGTIQMEIEQSADEISGFNTDNQPLIDKRTAKSFISVQDREIIVLGGLQKDSNIKTRKGFPIISEIPLLGALFGSNKQEKTRDEIIFFIQPRVLKDTTEANVYAREQLNQYSARKDVQKHLRRQVTLPPTGSQPAPAAQTSPTQEVKHTAEPSPAPVETPPLPQAAK
jgi:general secretion pathway protein D